MTENKLKDGKSFPYVLKVLIWNIQKSFIICKMVTHLLLKLILNKVEKLIRNLKDKEIHFT